MSETSKPMSELTDSELEQEFLEALENLDPDNREIATALLLAMGAGDEKEVDS